MEEVFLTVKEICGDYAILVSDSGEERQTALFLLPEGTTDGSRLRFFCFEYELIK